MILLGFNETRNKTGLEISIPYVLFYFVWKARLKISQVKYAYFQNRSCLFSVKIKNPILDQKARK